MLVATSECVSECEKRLNCGPRLCLESHHPRLLRHCFGICGGFHQSDVHAPRDGVAVADGSTVQRALHGTRDRWTRVPPHEVRHVPARRHAADVRAVGSPDVLERPPARGVRRSPGCSLSPRSLPLHARFMRRLACYTPAARCPPPSSTPASPCASTATTEPRPCASTTRLKPAEQL